MLDLAFQSLISLWIQKDLSLVVGPADEDPGGILQQELQKDFTETHYTCYLGTSALTLELLANYLLVR